jgi:hypothetical protein
LPLGAKGKGGDGAAFSFFLENPFAYLIAAGGVDRFGEPALNRPI